MVKTHAQKWFDQLEVTLAHEAEQAGLFEHNTLIGSAREFFLKRVLRSILPPTIHVATGKIIDAQGNASNQIDIILFDSRFPVLEIDSGVGTYPLEGVIATIEVKSTLTTRELYTALDNTRSLIDLTPGLEQDTPLKEHMRELVKSGSSETDAKRKAYFEWIPAGYIYAFTSRIRKRGLSKAVNEWFISNEQPAVSEGLCAILPRAIVAGLPLGYFMTGFLK